MRFSCFLLASTLLSGLAIADADVDPRAISAVNLANHVRTLASDEFEGRAPTTQGEDKTIAYLSEQFAAAGLKPGGPDGRWTQDVPLVRSRIDGDVSVAFDVRSEHLPLRQADDIVVQTLYPTDHVKVEKAPMVFVGYGVHAPELGWDDYKGVDLKGKIAIVLINDPDFESAKPGVFGGRAITYYGRWTYKYEEAARRGATGVLIVHETAPAAYGWATVRNGGIAPLFDIEREDAEKAHLPVRGWVQQPIAADLFKRAGLDLAKLKKRAQDKTFKPVALNDVTFSSTFKVVRDRVITRNVLAKLEGAERPHETVIFSGHWDAFGIGKPDARGDTVHRGAVDNATALASMLEIARVFANGPRPERSLLFFAPTAEERGLLGAYYYVENPVVPLEKTAAVINIEMLSPDGPTRDIASWGVGRVSLEQDLARIAKANDRYYAEDPNVEAGFFFRADHFPFARKGVPAITIGPGVDKIEGGKAAGQAARAKYFAERYHQPADDWSADWDMDAQAADVELIRQLGESIANSKGWPHWLDGSDYKAIRQKSDGQRRCVDTESAAARAADFRE
jgi:Zn-dependent M28 family amino/carboxypeptidase